MTFATSSSVSSPTGLASVRLGSYTPRAPATLFLRTSGTTTLFASLDVATGEVLGNFSPRHGVSDFLDFLKLLNRTYPRRELHLIVDNYHTHKNLLVKEWLSRHRRFHMHFTPTSSSWLNQVEGWFSLLSRRAIRRGVFQSVGQLIDAIQRFIAAWNSKRHPFVWVKTADEILSKPT